MIWDFKLTVIWFFIISIYAEVNCWVEYNILTLPIGTVLTIVINRNNEIVWKAYLSIQQNAPYKPEDHRVLLS